MLFVPAARAALWGRTWSQGQRGVSSVPRALAHNLANFMASLALPEAVEQ